MSQFMGDTNLNGTFDTLKAECHQEVPWQASEVGPGESHEVQQSQVQGLSPGFRQSKLSGKTEGWMNWM